MHRLGGNEACLIPATEPAAGHISTTVCASGFAPVPDAAYAGSGFADFAHTLRLSGLSVTDEAGNTVENVRISSSSGQPYTTNGVLKAFANSTVTLRVYLGSRAMQLRESFTLNAESDGINPITDSFALNVGSLSIGFPAGSFRRDKSGRFWLVSLVRGLAVAAQIAPQGDSRFDLTMDIASANPIDLTIPAVRLSIGDDGNVTAPTITFSKW